MTKPIVLVCLLLLCFGCACRKKVQPADTASPVPAATAAERDPASAPASPKTPAPKPSAPAVVAQCVDDRGCEGYLRCVEQTCQIPPAVSGIAPEGMPTAAFVADGKERARFHIELADEPWERTRGLMFRRKMDPSFGMLFVFDGDVVRSFWMKNTYLPLDMVHIDSKGKVVGVVANAEPMTTSSRQTGKPARYVLELVAGAAAKHGIEEGVTMKLENVSEALRPR